MPQPRIHVAPKSHPLFAEVEKTVSGAGGELSPAADAEALIWLGHKEVENLKDVLHPGIKWVQLRAAGVEKWFGSGEIDDLRQFTGLQGGYSEQVAEHAVALLLACAKELKHFSGSTSWRLPDRPLPRPVRGSTIAVIGAGDIGREIIRLLQPFKANIIAVTRSGKPVPGATKSIGTDQLASVWPEADYIVLAAPATAETHHMVGAAELAMMRKDACLINVGRGPLIDTPALQAALKEKRIGVAAVDVVDPEPLPDGHPLWSEPALLITPHTANPPEDARSGLLARIAENVERYVAGRPLLGIIDKTRGY